MSDPRTTPPRDSAGRATDPNAVPPHTNINNSTTSAGGGNSTAIVAIVVVLVIALLVWFFVPFGASDDTNVNVDTGDAPAALETAPAAEGTVGDPASGTVVPADDDAPVAPDSDVVAPADTPVDPPVAVDPAPAN